jgi:transcriptional regulator with XRE-family HTH domain
VARADQRPAAVCRFFDRLISKLFVAKNPAPLIGAGLPLRYKLAVRQPSPKEARNSSLLNGCGGAAAIGTKFVKKSPNPIDRHVGSRVRMRRVMLGMSQEKLGEALGLTFQQVQKYEKGINRIGASRLQQISQTLDVSPSFFFEGAPSFEPAVGPEQNLSGPSGVAEGSPATYVADFLSTPEALHLNMAFARIHDPKIRKRIVDLVCSLAGEETGPQRAEPPQTAER